MTTYYRHKSKLKMALTIQRCHLLNHTRVHVFECIKYDFNENECIMYSSINRFLKSTRILHTTFLVECFD